jgi:uncharacterized membrane protein
MATSATTSTAVTKGPRLPAIDLMRGIVMILMTIDHASHTFNKGRIFGDSVFQWKPGTQLPAGQFLTRWITHLCAPTFVLLAGTALALSTDARVKRGDRAADIDRHIATRGALLVALDAVWMSFVFVGPGKVLFQVLYAIGASFLCMVPLRRLSDRALLAVGLGLALLDEPLLGVLSLGHLEQSLPAALVASGGYFANGHFLVGYPLFPWLGMMCAGWVLGRKLLALTDAERSTVATRILLAWGVGLLLLFAVVRGANSFGNMLLYRDDGSLVQWLHVSKYPPSIAYIGLELGIASLMLAALFAVTQRRPGFASPVQTLGKVALFYYLLHAHLMLLAGWLAGVIDRFDVASAYLGAAATVAALYPLCGVYRRYKVAHPGGWTRYV